MKEWEEAHWSKWVILAVFMGLIGWGLYSWVEASRETQVRIDTELGNNAEAANIAGIPGVIRAQGFRCDRVTGAYQSGRDWHFLCDVYRYRATDYGHYWLVFRE